jgi:putative heme iron utilization protein
MGRNAPGRGAEATPDRVVRRLVRSALKGALATLDRSSGHPYASLVTVATDAAGEPLLLVSRLAIHTQNLERDARASLLVDASGSDGDPLAGGRVSVIGRAVRLDPGADATERRRFLARHPAAEGYAGFADFAFWRLVVERAHYVGGFGRIVALAREDIVLDLAGRERLLAAEADIVAHMNADHADALALYATRLLGAEPSDWRMTGIDPEGLDLVAGGMGLRLEFDSAISTPAEARGALAALAGAARSSQ